MKMNKMFAGLIAFVAGVALSAGSAFATNGYVGGDFARMKLVPYFETGDSRATIIGIQNLSMQEADTMRQHRRVRDLQAYLNGEDPSTTLITDAGSGGYLENDIALPVSGTPLNMDDLTEVANVQEALEAAQMAALDEHLFVAVNVYDSMGMMMENASTELCLAEHQFGVVVLQGPSAMMADGHQMRTLSAMDEEIPPYGYVEIVADERKYSACESASFRDPVKSIDTRPAGTGTGQLDATGEEPVYTGANSMIAAWTIIQDVGMGFFGTEVPTSTISRMADDMTTDMDESMMTNCYNPDGVTETPELTDEEFNMSMCGLIPERHNNAAFSGTDGAPEDVDTRTPRTRVIARYDAGDESMVVVWLAAGMDTEDTPARARRMLDVVVKCTDGTVMTGMDQYGDPTTAIKVPAPGMVTMIDPNGDELGPYTSECADDRGVLRITMPDGSDAGAVFSHITQMDGHYRMNFPGYSMANPDSCTGMSTADTDADEIALCMAP